MKNAQPSAISLKDYKVPPFLIDETDLKVELGEQSTRVFSTLKCRKNPKSNEQYSELELNGVDLELISLAIDGKTLQSAQYRLENENLIILNVPDQFVLSCETRIYPQKNTCLEGLYKSSGMFCTQCEAEGFRRITFYLDRPDVMSKFTTSIIADRTAFPVLLSNGNKIDSGELEEGRHYAVWEDPFPKPCYLFALVAGDLVEVSDTFKTMSGRQVDIKMYVESKNRLKCDHAIASLKHAMRWDEEVYGREYDLDIFMIVAVDAFNMGAMENKGLNIFNSSCVLANSETATDATWQRIEAIVAHEYFHNWSGNRVTCRDWFQLSLKEGFTVFRDASFSADMNSASVKRIEDVNLLRTAQFSEDSGPMAHPIRPDSYIEISNFYTLTIYEKGAEVVGMIKTLIGENAFRAGSDLYFLRHDGQAVTTEEFVKAMEDASGVDLSQFRLWYSQAGTPHVQVIDEYDSKTGVYRLKMKQSCPPTPGQTKKLPLLIPIGIGLLDEQGQELPLSLSGKPLDSSLLTLTESEQVFEFDGLSSKPTPSLLRGFSAPVKLHFDYRREQLCHLAMYDTDQFNRWNAGQLLAQSIILQLMKQESNDAIEEEDLLVNIYQSVLQDDSLDDAIKAKMLMMPSEAYLIEILENVDVDAVHQSRSALLARITQRLKELITETYQKLKAVDEYKADFPSMAKRELKNALLGMLLHAGVDESAMLAWEQFKQANNMTDEAGALKALVNSHFVSQREQALCEFYEKWKDDVQVMELWLSIQCGSPTMGQLSHIKLLTDDPVFDIANPNKVRSVIGAFCNQSLVNFHEVNGTGYRFLADNVIELNKLNPQIASRLVLPLTHWAKFEVSRKSLMKLELERILRESDLSKDLFEVVSKSLKS
jgi:aminopeptidase N